MVRASQSKIKNLPVGVVLVVVVVLVMVTENVFVWFLHPVDTLKIPSTERFGVVFTGVSGSNRKSRRSDETVVECEVNVVEECPTTSFSVINLDGPLPA